MQCVIQNTEPLFTLRRSKFEFDRGKRVVRILAHGQSKQQRTMIMKHTHSETRRSIQRQCECSQRTLDSFQIKTRKRKPLFSARDQANTAKATSSSGTSERRYDTRAAGSAALNINEEQRNEMRHMNTQTQTEHGNTKTQTEHIKTKQQQTHPRCCPVEEATVAG